MTLAAFVLLAAMMPSMTESTGRDTDPLSRYRWTHRLLVIHVPDGEAGRAALHAFRTAVEAAMEDVRDRDLLIVPVGDLPRAGNGLEPAVDLGPAERSAVRQRLGLQESGCAARADRQGRRRQGAAVRYNRAAPGARVDHG